MRSARYANSRQKACQQCSSAKAKCDRKDGCCTRCSQRSLICTYHHDARPVASASPQGGSFVRDVMPRSPISLTNNLESNRSQGDVNFWTSTMQYTPEIAPSRSSTSINSFSDIRSSGNDERDTAEAFDFSGLRLFCPIDVNEISTRWMNPYIPDPEKTAKNYPPNVIAFISRILKSYASMAMRGREPPFVHASQRKDARSNAPMATCLSLVRICQDPLPGSESVAVAVLQREMETIAKTQCADDTDLLSLATFQAYLIYALVLFFGLGQGLGPLRETIIPLQALAHRACGRRIVCVADQTRTRPKWEEWIVAEAKRRTLYVMYLFDSILCAQEGLPVFLGSELQGLPAPGSRSQWHVQDRADWERAFNLHLAEWAEEYLTIDELWPIPIGFDGHDISRRQKRVDRWLMDVDEFGTMLFTVTACTHGT
ncbi:unnamed protein product [Penicillium olsonii]|uniref:Zn(2)-C6 fungal-type domain-containing protein n=1 Tax=Penicillium olsonii TaxID=99116 RepID=A0A9W4HVQ5_PENOL|nr:unnamed protein product [Penicillium olsonii]